MYTSPHMMARRDTATALTIVFIAATAIAVLLTVGGAHAFFILVAAAGSFKSGVIASVLGLGLVFLGPALLLGVAVLLPRWWFRDIKKGFTDFFHATTHSTDSRR